MGTIVTVDVPDHGEQMDPNELGDLVDRALDWFRQVERTCSRFDPGSELQEVCRRVGHPTTVSPLLFEIVRFALAVASETDGAFDPTVGRQLEADGFNQHYRTGQTIMTAEAADPSADWRDVHLDDSNRTIALERPLLLDLGGVAKGMALDLASRDLASLGHFVVDAGGDLYLGGHGANDASWTVGIRHPERDDVLLDHIRVRNQAVCTSGVYERRSATKPEARHVVDPRTGSYPRDLMSATVVASSAMLADALATATLVLGLERGRALLDAHGVCGVMFSASADRVATHGCRSDILLPH